MSEEVKLTASEVALSKLLIRMYFILLEGKVPGPGFIPFTLIKPMAPDDEAGIVTILLSTLVILPNVK